MGNFHCKIVTSGQAASSLEPLLSVWFSWSAVCMGLQEDLTLGLKQGKETLLFHSLIASKGEVEN